MKRKIENIRRPRSGALNNKKNRKIHRPSSGALNSKKNRGGRRNNKVCCGDPRRQNNRKPSDEPAPIISSDEDCKVMDVDVDWQDLSLQEVLFDAALKNISGRDLEDLETAPSGLLGLPRKPPDAKMKGVDTSCSLKVISRIETHNSRHERGGSSYALCAICDDAKPPSAMKRWTHCRHRYCEDCIKEYVRGNVKEDVHGIKCPESDCKKNLDIKFCLDSVDSVELMKRWNDAELEAEVLAKPSTIKCPFQDCSRTFLDDGKGFLIKACPKCWRIFCRDCKVKWHMGMECGQYQLMLQMKKILSKYKDDEGRIGNLTFHELNNARIYPHTALLLTLNDDEDDEHGN